MIDEKGRLFGKVNIVDLIIVVVILAAVAYLAITFLGPESTIASSEDVTVTFYTEEIPDYVVAALEEGSKVWDLSDNVTIGTVDSWSVSDSISYVVNDTQTASFETPKTGYNALSLNVSAQGVIEEHGVRIGGVLYGVGHTVTMYAGEAKLYIKVSSIEAA